MTRNKFSSFAKAFLLSFTIVWLVAMAADAVAYLHWPNPLKWTPGARKMIFIEGLLISVMPGFMWATRP
jgi:hypothetical protein